MVGPTRTADPTRTDRYAVVHRDLKCANLLLDGAGNILVADLGSSSLGSSDHPPDLKTVAGTPYHMSSHVAAGRPYGPDAADLPSLAVCIMEMLVVNKHVKDLRHLGLPWGFRPGQQDPWEQWMEDFGAGRVHLHQGMPEGARDGTWPASLRSFVADCCSQPAAGLVTWAAYRTRLDRLLQHDWLQAV